MSIIQGTSKSSADAAYSINQSIRFNDDDSAYLTRTPSVEGNRRTFTFSTWVKFATLKADTILFSSWVSSGASSYQILVIDSDFRMRVADHSANYLITKQKFRDVGSWYHIVWRSDTTNSTSGDRYQLYVNGSRVTVFDTESQPSLNFQGSVNQTQPHYLGRNGYNLAMVYSDLYQAETHFLDGVAYDASFFGETDSATGQWIPKKYTGGNYGTNGFYITGEDSTFLGQDVRTSGDQVNSFQASQWTGATGSYTFTDGRIQADTDNKAIKSVDTFTGDFEFSWRYIDMANFVIGFYEIDEDSTFSDSSSAGNMQNMTDSWYVQTSSVSANRDIFYGGAVQVNATTIANGDTWKLQRSSGTIKVYRNGSVVHTFSQTSTNEVRLVVAQGDATADVGEVNWVDNATLGNNLFSSGLSTADQMLDTPTNNFCVLSPIDSFGSGLTLSDGNLRAVPAASAYGNNHGTFYIDSGKWVFECKHTSVFGEACGWSPSGELTSGSSDRGYFMFADGRAYDNITNTGTKGASLSDGDFRYVFYDADAQAMWFAHVDVSNSNALVYDNSATKSEIEAGTTTNAVFTNIPSGFWAPGIWMDTSGVIEVNFGQSAFATTSALPSGFNTLKADNLPDPTIKDPSAHFQTTLYTGNGSTQSISQSGNLSTFQPDWVWGKGRSTAESHALFDAVRGTTKIIYSNLANAEATNSGVTAFNSDGFSIGSSASLNNNTQTYVAWQWKANGSGSSNNDGSVTSTVSNNSTANFSIVKYTGTGSGNSTVGHGLGTTPTFIFCKHLGRSQNWRVFCGAVGAGQTGFLNDTAAFAADPDRISAVSSTTFTAAANMNESADYIAYCFADVPGYSASGVYAGNSSSDGPFVFTGFKVQWLLVKCTNASSTRWLMHDTTRNNPPGGNVTDTQLFAELSSAESVDSTYDFLSNGFKPRRSDGNHNLSGRNYMYLAFSETPFKTATAR